MIRINRYFKHQGFTLLELLIVVIIVGILASLALPRFLRAAEKARWAEARSMLGAIRGSQIRYQVENGSYTAVIGDLDVEIPAGRYFTFTAGAAVASLGTATRNAFQPGGATGGTVSISETGDFTYGGGAPGWVQ